MHYENVSYMHVEQSRDREEKEVSLYTYTHTYVAFARQYSS